ncbi:AGE family epimerase/isomerase [Flavobacterium silvaticum]|uniref:Cellobiose 2-epimerase n=1 Tax=Flavobacterium silvaticum TaxID=1852020 RepID=A0A972JFQ7_9FLAO|nr:AGE family epimerase/isomerase [Flavobacterium silvaticum]NMH27416.1 N-acyl-D-glucosamine 2-epimerase [Flavobacterium silvaticum]
MQSEINVFKTELIHEAKRILSFWATQAVDTVNGGFLGQIDFNNQKHPEADKGSVLNARILWTFSSAYRQFPKEEYKIAANRAFDYFTSHFHDTWHGGVFWSVSADGNPAETKKQVYAIAFAIYGLAEYYAAFSNPEALDLAISLYLKIEEHSFDKTKNGYFEAFTRDWQPIADLRLSDKDANEKKTMNTHLHIAEAYATLYSVWPDKELGWKLENLLVLFDTVFLHKETGNFKLFFNEDWIEKPDVISYGHDIEAAWLLLRCAEILGNEILIKAWRTNAILIADATKTGIDSDGGLWYEYDAVQHTLMAEKHWWPQSEMQVGYFTAWKISGDRTYLDIVLKNWEFTKKYLVDLENGEWIWGINADYSAIQKDKAGFWKCPYHNTRGCLELIAQL